jgi:ABC-type phosphate transport system substrate-binding protein
MSSTKGITRILVFAAVLALPVALAAEVHCPSGSTPPASSTVNGGLDVDGTCIVDKVTVNGGITVEAGGHLQFTNGTVNGGIVDLPCGELDVNATTGGNGVPITGAKSLINGGIDIEASDVCPMGAFSDADIWTAQINGGISMTGTYAVGFVPIICGNTIKGNMDVNNVTVVNIGTFEATIGDPDSANGRPCPGNTITGAFIMNNSTFFAVESNT